MHEPFGMEDHSDGTAVLSRDPVCGMSVDEGKAAGKTGYAGQMYYFCSRGCMLDFQDDPEKYLDPSYVTTGMDDSSHDA